MYDVLIVGSGPAGMTAAIYAARMNLKVCVLEKSAPFYYNFLGRLISLEHNTFLPTKSEAEAFVVERARKFPDHLHLATCMYADYGNMEVHEIGRKDFKQLKKTYKIMRKQK